MVHLKKFPFYKQLDQMDCGPTCLRMISSFYGKNFSLQQLREKSFLTREGVSLLGVSQAAESVGFRTMGTRITMNQLINEAPLPCIVHWYQRHFVVLYKVKDKQVWVADPAKGLIKYSIKEFLKGWLATNDNGREMGIVLLLETTPEFYDQEDWTTNNKYRSIQYLLNYLSLHKSFLLQLIIGLLAGSLIQLILPFLTQSIVDVGIRAQNINFIYLVLAGQMMLFMGRASIDFIRSWLLLHLSTRINISIISDFLVKIFKLPISFFEGKMIGDILRRIDDHSRIEKFISSSTLNMIFSFFNLFVFSVVLALYDIPIILVFITMSTVYIVYVLLFMKKRGELDYKRFQQMADTQSSLIQTVQGMSEVKLNNCETLKRWEWERIQAKLFKVNVESTKLMQYQDGGSLLLNESKNMIITAMSALAVIDGRMTLGMMLAVQYIIGQLSGPINDFIVFVREWQDARISLERIGEIHEHNNEEDESVLGLGWIKKIPQNKTIQIEKVRFQYEGPRSPIVLDEIDLTIPQGKITAIVGVSGSGKTTLMKLLLKFYKTSGGRITLGNEDLEEIPGSLWREKCGVVMQDGYIFSDTILRNIALSGEEFDRERLLHAVNIANIKEFIESLPLGYNTKVGANGIGLSQGQKQRILIARAVYKNPEFIFFDEATSSLDANNERMIMGNLNEFFEGKTVLIIAHRLSTVKNADQIVVLENGRIAERGDHQELTKKKGAYYELVKNQLELGT